MWKHLSHAGIISPGPPPPSPRGRGFSQTRCRGNRLGLFTAWNGTGVSRSYYFSCLFSSFTTKRRRCHTADWQIERRRHNSDAGRRAKRGITERRRARRDDESALEGASEEVEVANNRGKARKGEKGAKETKTSRLQQERPIEREIKKD